MARVLIVDDSLMIRTLLREILASAGHEIVGEAADGLQAEACVRRLLPDLVTLDLVMPVRGGLDSIPYLLEVDRSLAVVVCSASLDQRRVLTALRHGAIGFIVKPFDAQSVLTNLDAALALATSRNHAAAAGPNPAPPKAIPAGDRSNEQREFTRVTAALAVRVTPPNGRPLVTVTVDLSGNGLRLSTGNLTLETRVDFRLELSAAQPPILGRARVARVDGDGRPALAFEHVSVADHERLNAYIQQHAPPSQARPAIAP
jgi:two-component system, chemotaxis family, chemotaxis protein CheY